ncbi:TonB-dependent receptor [Sphingobacterium sp.]|uniref:SusC/RagA family TonB-linked outer membrane protein n=1 Tax=Sphingobacterium sp. TaxID=341027 RepID=UPI0031D3BB58
MNNKINDNKWNGAPLHGVATNRKWIKPIFFLFACFVSHESLSAKANGMDKIVVSQSKIVVTGIVRDTLGNAMSGVSVSIKGKTLSTASDQNGRYALEVNKGETFVFKSVGYITREFANVESNKLDVVLQSDTRGLEEVVVIGSGVQKKVTVTGAITSVKGSDLRSPSSSLTSALAGRLPGIIVNTTSGQPGAQSNFYIRGISTFGGRTTPLILLDDVEISAGDLNNIPAETIESFTLLKDASATAIYGARGANGVMLVTTKLGKLNEKNKINITLENAVQAPMNFPDFVNGPTWMELYNEALTTRNPTANPRFSQELIDNTRSGKNPFLYPDVNWKELIFKDKTMTQRANVNIQGGGSKATYYTSLNVNHDNGLLNSPQLYSFKNNINNMSYNFQNNVQIKVTPTTTVRLNMNAQVRDNKGPNYSPADLFDLLFTTNPVYFPSTIPGVEGDRHVRFGNKILTGNTLRTNPYAYMVSSFKQSDLNTLNTSLRIDQNLDVVTKGLSVNALINFKNYSVQSFTRTIDPYYYQIKSYDEATNTYQTERLGTSGTDYINTSAVSRASDRTIAMQFQLNYQRQFGLHNVGGMLMYMQRDYRTLALPNRNQGYSGRFMYDYDNRYLAEFNFGYNGTERLAKADRFELFPAVSLGWVISNEPFFKPVLSTISSLKLRGSYGIVGSDGLNYPENFVYMDQVTLNNIGFTTGDNLAVTKYGPLLERYAVANATWERSRKMNIGMDINLFSKWDIVFDYFREKRYNILMMRASWPNMLGYSNAVPYAPVGKMDSWGAELSSNYRQRIGEDITLDLRANLTYVRNKYVYKDEIWHEYPWQVETGRPLSTHFGYVADGLFANQEEINNHARQELGSKVMVGDIKYRDLNGDGVINSYDQAYISDFGTQPRLQYGMGFNIRYKKVDFGVFLNGSTQRKISINGNDPFGQQDYNVFQYIADDRWTEANQNANAAYPRIGLTETETANNRVNSTYWLRNGRFLRLKQVELGYRFKYGRIYFTGDNLALFSPFKEWDPELSWNSYPLQRTFNLGLQLNF